MSTMNAARWMRFVWIALPALLATGCGSGGVSSPPDSVAAGPITVSPSSATLYSDLPTTFVISGGNGSYIATSSNQNVLPVVTAFSENTLTVVPNQVAADTPVILTIRDTGSTAPVSVQLTVKPRTISNTVTITPSASQSAACGSSVCAGGDAEVAVSLSQAGVPLAGRQVRFDVVSGDFRLIAAAPGVGEALALSTTAVTDSTGTARVRLRVLSEATSQTALLDITDTSTGQTQRTSFTIAPSSNAPLNAQPSSIAFIGRDATGCASGVAADVIVFGGRPPYAISQPGTFAITPTVVARSGDRFTVTSTGQCTDGATIAVVDANGATAAVTASNVRGNALQTSALVVSPSAVTLDTCNTIALVAVAGGTGSYFASSAHSSVQAFVLSDSHQVQIRRLVGSPAMTTSPITVGISDGRTVQSVTVTVTGAGAGPC